MENQRLDLGVVSDLSAESFGEPGARTFRVLGRTAEGQVSLWLEKEQLVMLGNAIEELLGRVPESQGATPESDLLRSFVGELEVKVGALAIGFDPDHSGFTLEAGDFDSPFEISSIHLLATRQQLVDLEEQITEIVAQGRPRCPLCGRPITGGSHFCPPSNGHAKIANLE